MDESKDDEWFKEIYGKEYTGPPKPSRGSSQDAKKRPVSESCGSDEDEAPPDPNAFPTDFTSREAKVWEAKVKAQERHWKRKKDEELTCRICGEYGHFTQGCPSTLGVKRKQAEVVEKISVKDKGLKPKILGTGGATIQSIEKETGCKLKLEDDAATGFVVRISGSNRIMVRKAVEAVEKLLDRVHDDDRRRGRDSEEREHYLSGLQSRHSDRSPQRYSGRDALYSERAERVNHLDSRRPLESDTLNGSLSVGFYGHKGGSQFEESRGLDRFERPRTLEQLEHKFLQEITLLKNELTDAEDKENARHCEVLREIQERYQDKMMYLRLEHAKYKEELLHQEAELRHQQYQHYQQPSSQGSLYNREVGYGLGSDDRKEHFGGYSSFGDGGYHSSRNSRHEYGDDYSGASARAQAYSRSTYHY